MKQEVFSIKLPVGESLRLIRNRFESSADGGKRVSIVTGIHGDELEGQYVTYLLSNWLNQNQEKIRGTIDIYPAVNSLGIDTIKRALPFYEVDLNRQFPGSKTDFLPAQFADGIVNAVRGSDIAIDIHSSNIFLREIPQVRISTIYENELVPLAKLLNIDFIWVHDAVTVLESTFSHALNSLGTKTLVVEMGVGMRITKEYGQNLFKGILNLLAHEGVIENEPIENIKEPIYSKHGEVSYINSSAAGLFIPRIDHCQMVEKGDVIGEVVDPLLGVVECEVISPCRGILFTLREYPIVYEGSLLARIFEGTK
ncbi:MAG TPA: M14 family metallopeptidase [Campylobacterales bacterium]|nr:M14 family metallopeptidase [Campylobacterales bacterium]